MVERIADAERARRRRADRRQQIPASRSNPANFTDDRFGVPTVRDILAELEKPGRDPRPEFKTAAFKEGVEEIRTFSPAWSWKAW